uniref:Uncharacterized protein n=1 Tax=Setaria viridis TaxID=4556 RepID=A0A4U6UYG6_SETVI|nr:hypothetical protein SEVIR_4G140001v2 [Setaria viridis]
MPAISAASPPHLPPSPSPDAASPSPRQPLRPCSPTAYLRRWRCATPWSAPPRSSRGAAKAPRARFLLIYSSPDLAVSIFHSSNRFSVRT